MNPLLAPWDTPFELPPFAEIRDEDFGPAMEAALKDAETRLEEIATNPAAPDFANTIEALERAEALLTRVELVFSNLTLADSTEARQALDRDLSPRLARFAAAKLTDARLFRRVDALFKARETSGLSAEQMRVLEVYHTRFLRAGAALPAAKRKRMMEIAERLATLGTAFSQNLLADEKDWLLPLSQTDGDMDGLPETLIAAARQAAEERGLDGHVITLSRSMVMPFLQTSARRDLREKAFRALKARGANGGATDNLDNVREILALRAEQAQLLGYENFSAFRLDDEMAKTPDAVRNLLMAVWEPARAAAARDAKRLAALMQQDGINDALQPWDWAYYAARLKKLEHDLDDAEIKPYFQLDKMIEAAFAVANRLFGLTFTPLDVPLYHPDARAWEVRKGARHMGVFIGDYYARPSKRSGAWCWQFRGQSKLDGDVRPVVVNVCNSAKPPAGEPALLTFDDVRTLFHEFGHALHTLLSDVTYPRISGTEVALDYVELPSQLYEHWASVPEILQTYALHAETGEPMPEALLKRVLGAENFDQGAQTVEYVASALVDLDFHDGPPPRDPVAAEGDTLARLGMPAALTMRHATPHFGHAFSAEHYASGYYSYMWSEVMDADAFAAFTEAGDPFDPETAARLEKHIYAAGNSRDPADLYTAFRGGMPTVDALLKGRGLVG